MSEVEKALDFARRYHQETGNIPSVRRVCREANLTPPRFYRVFKNLEGFCERAGIKIDKETLERIRSTRKATKRRTRKKSQRARWDSNPTMTVEGEGPKPRTASTFEEIQHNREVEEEARKERIESTGRFAGNIELLVLDADPEVSGLTIDALSNVVPTILKKKYGVQATLKDLVEAGRTLSQVREERKKQREKQVQLDGLLKKHELERASIQAEREKIRLERQLDPEKAALQDHVKTLHGEKKVLIDNLNEACSVNRNFRMVAIAWLGVLEQCGSCQKRFIQVLDPFPQVRAWFLRGQWGALSFEFIDTSKLPSRT